MRNRLFFMGMLMLLAINLLQAQRTYQNSSVLANGNWYKISVGSAGIYKVDIGLLNKLGINTSNISSTSIRLFGNGGGMLPEACNGLKTDDLVENAIQMIDGGDGIFNGNDYFLFYAPGPDIWLKDSANQRFRHQKNLYSNSSFYYITIGGNGARLQDQVAPGSANTTVSSFSERYFHELDTINLLNGSKDWYGEEFSTSVGTTRSFNLPVTNINIGQPATLVSNCIARSVNGSSRFSASINGLSALQQDIAAVGNSNLDLFARSNQSVATFNPASTLSMQYSFTPGGSGAQGWLDWFEVFYRKNLVFNNSEQLPFRDWKSVAAGNIARYTIQNAAAAQVWDITNSIIPIRMGGTVSGNDLSFVNEASSLHEYIAFSPAAALMPVASGKVANQDLHNSQSTDLIIVSYPPLLQQAQRIAAFHQQKDNLKTVTVTTDQVFNEFSSGTPDPTAIRDFVKMYYDKAGQDSTKRPKYLLLLGDASYDYKDRIKNNTNYVPAYENTQSLNPLSSYTSDDFFGFLDDNEDINATGITNLLDIGIGRIPAQTSADAKDYADKLLAYTDTSSLGAWRNQQTFIADDQDNNLHLNDAEAITAAAAASNPLFVQQKIYLDAYTQTSTTAGSRYPAVNQAINDKVQQGTLIMNYNGHGSSSRLAEEVILEKDMVDTWSNGNRLPLFITATCDFAPYDNPAVSSLGENILLREKTGGIALMTTTRLVFAYSNRIMNTNYLKAALQPKADGSYPSLGEAVKMAKNITYQTQSDATNNRKFTLLGDPALTLAFPKYRVQTETINDSLITAVPDTLKALQQYKVGGSIRDGSGQLLTNFNGSVDITVTDKPDTITTLANDADSYQQAFQVTGASLFKGKAKVVNGKFSFSFIVPQDINYQLGSGRISYYANNGLQDANGSFNGFFVGGSQGISSDSKGPTVNAYLNDESFKDDAVVNPTPLLLLKLTDASGINIAGTGIGHNMTAVIDSDATKIYVLNSFFEADLDSYQTGTVKFQLPEIAEGSHTITIKVWDVANNSTQVILHFRVQKTGLRVYNLINYPNPFVGHTNFRFDHNRPNNYLDVSINIFTPFGKLVKTIRTTINTNGNRSSDISWDGTGENGVMLAPGVYVYRVMAKSQKDGDTAFCAGKLVLF
ncbi:MAG: type IX secretion system sortase PorU [Chitinophagaceae bacterium]